MQQFRAGLVFKAHRLCVSLNFRLGSTKEEEEEDTTTCSALCWYKNFRLASNKELGLRVMKETKKDAPIGQCGVPCQAPRARISAAGGKARLFRLIDPTASRSGKSGCDVRARIEGS